MMIHPKKILVLLLLISSSCLALSQQQDTLPGFSVTKKNGKVFLRWFNKYNSVKQVSIQRSADGKRNSFKTIISLPDPSAKENGYFDRTATSDSLYYRIYVQVEGTNFFYTPIKRPAAEIIEEVKEAEPSITNKEKQSIQRVSSVSPAAPSTPTSVPGALFKPIKSDSSLIVVDTFDYSLDPSNIALLKAKNDSIRLGLIQIKFVKPIRPRFEDPGYPSKMIYTLKDGNVFMDIPLAGKKKYNVMFLDENGNDLFEIPEVNQPKLTIDKVNFLHPGWFIFKLYEDGKLKEANRVYIPKE